MAALLASALAPAQARLRTSPPERRSAVRDRPLEPDREMRHVSATLPTIIRLTTGTGVERIVDRS
jgi:hypothetical protein